MKNKVILVLSAIPSICSVLFCYLKYYLPVLKVTNAPKQYEILMIFNLVLNTTFLIVLLTAIIIELITDKKIIALYCLSFVLFVSLFTTSVKNYIHDISFLNQNKLIAIFSVFSIIFMTVKISTYKK